MYIPSCALYIAEPCTFIADTLILGLQESNGLDAMPPEQRIELIRLLSEGDAFSIHDELPAPQWQTDCYDVLAKIQACTYGYK